MTNAVKLSGVWRPAVLCAALVMSAATAAHAQSSAIKGPSTEPTRARECPLPEAKIEISGKHASLCFPVARKIVTSIHLPESATGVYRPESDLIDTDFIRVPGFIHATAMEGTPIGAEHSVKLEGAGYTVAIYFVAVPPSTMKRTDFVIEHISDRELDTRARLARAEKLAAESRRIAAEAKRKEKALEAERDRLRIALSKANKQARLTIKEREQEQKARATLETELTKAKSELQEAILELDKALQELEKAREQARDHKRSVLLDSWKRNQKEMEKHVPIIEGWAPVKGTPLRVRWQAAHWAAGYFAMPVDLLNPESRPVALDRLRIVTRSRVALPMELLEPRGLENTASGVITTLPERSHERVVLAVEIPPGMRPQDLLLELGEHNSLNPPVFAQVPRFYLPETELEKQRRLWAEQIIVGPRATYGVCWLASGVDSDENLDATSCTAIGAYLTYPLFVSERANTSFALEFEALGSRTGNASFSGVMVDGNEGDLTRKATLGRFAAHGVIRPRSGRIAPYFRFGIGVQGTNYDGELTVNGTTQEAPGSSFTVNGLWHMGAGLTFRLGDHLLASLAASFHQLVGNDSRSLSVAAHVGYGWNP